jgi:hypothetical protein
MIDLSNTTYAPVIEEITDVLCNKTQNVDKGFYRIEVAYFLAKMASSMRASIKTKDRGIVPVNVYALTLASSGYGKGHSVNIMENEFIRGFKRKFLEETMPEVARQHMDKIAQERAIKNNTDEAIERDIVEAEYKKLGAYPFTFDSGTSPAVKQLRDKLLLAAAGSINLQIDEVGSNLVNNTEVLNVFLELFDQGLVKQKLIKNTVDSTRTEEREGGTPTNMLLFGTPAKLFDGGLTEDAFYSFLEIGYARRCLFGIGRLDKKSLYSMTPAEIFAKLTDPSNSSTVFKWAQHFTQLADLSHYNYQMSIADATSIKLIEYKSECEKVADTLPEFEEIRKAELSHRYFKALKLAGALAFVDESPEVTLTHVLQAIKLVEDSGNAFGSILTREKPYMKLAKYIASTDNELTHADLNEALPFYKSSAAARNELMNLAVAWGYKNHIVIKKSFVDGIEFFKGETLKPIDLEKIIISWSTDFAFSYQTENAPWDKLDTLFLGTDLNWCNHGFVNGHRCNECTIPAFNIVVIDVDGTATLKATQELFKDYKYIIYTTKSHGTNGQDRFRLILPLNYTLEFSNDDYKEFMNNIIKWLPFKIDETSNQASKKWLSNDKGQIFKNDGECLDALRFIPRTSRNEQFEKDYSKIESMDNLERWFASRMIPGNRNNMMYKYAMALVDSGLDFNEVSERVKKFNKQSGCNLSTEELNGSILTSIAKKFQ